MSLISYIGTERNILDEAPENCHTDQAASPHPDQPGSGKAAPRLLRRPAGHHAAAPSSAPPTAKLASSIRLKT
jgi:hypothetical protein